jgi:hypothetical protein
VDVAVSSTVNRKRDRDDGSSSGDNKQLNSGLVGDNHGEDAADDSTRQQRRTAAAAAVITSEPEEIIRNGDGDDEDAASDLEEMTPEDAAGIADASDMAKQDVAWVKGFAETAVAGDALAPLSYRLRFCFDLADLPLSLNFCPRVRPGAPALTYVLLRQASSVDKGLEGRSYRPALVSEMLTALQSGLEAADDRALLLPSLVVAFETASGSGGLGGKCICRVRDSDAVQAVLAAMREEFGPMSITVNDNLKMLVDAELLG